MTPPSPTPPPSSSITPSPQVSTPAPPPTPPPSAPLPANIPVPKGIVNDFQSSLKLEISYLENYRTAVENLIVGVASAQGVTLSASSKPPTTGGQ